jgi:uroporphyrinogen decarboxylase
MIAAQTSVLLRAELFRQHFKPHHARITDLARRCTVKVECHCCGDDCHLIPEFIDMGIDIAEPIQSYAPERLARDFGKDLCFSGPVDVQQILPQGGQGLCKAASGHARSNGRVFSGAVSQHPGRHAP